MALSLAVARGTRPRVAPPAARRWAGIPTRVRPSIEEIDGLRAGRPGWDELAEAAGNVFATWDWADAWWAHFAAGGALMLRRVYAPDGRLAAILPLYRRSRGPVVLVRFVGHGPADELGPVCAPGDRLLAMRALRAVMGRLPVASLLLAERLPGDSATATGLGGRLLHRESTPVLTGGLSWEEWLATRSANFRQQVRRRERKLVREHGLTFRLGDDPARLDADLDTLLALHALRWGDESQAFAPPRDALHREVAHRALRAGRLRLWLAEIEGRPVAAWYGFRFAGREIYYQSGRDPAWDREGVGYALLAHTVRSALDDGVAEYRFGLGDESYKDRFADTDPGLDTVYRGRGPVTALVSVAASGMRRLPRGLRRAALRRVG